MCAFLSNIAHLIRTAQPQCQPKSGAGTECHFLSEWQYRQQLSKDPLGIPAVLLPSSSLNHPSQITPYAHSASQSHLPRTTCLKNIPNSLVVHVQPQLYTAKTLTQLSRSRNWILCEFTLKKIWYKECNRPNN